MNGMLCSDGKASARVFVVLALPVSGPRPRDERARVIVTPPSDVPPRPGAVRSSGPRRPDQMRRRERPPPVDLPDGRSALQTQRIIIDPEWLEEMGRASTP